MRLEGFSVFGEGAVLATVSGFSGCEFGYPNTKYFEGSSGAPGVFTPTPPTGARGVNKLRRGTAETPTPRTAISPEYE